MVYLVLFLIAEPEVDIFTAANHQEQNGDKCDLLPLDLSQNDLKIERVDNCFVIIQSKVKQINFTNMST